MKRALILLLALPSFAMAGCATAGGEPPIRDLGAGPCRNDGLERFVGQAASADLGAQMLAASGARTLRWGAPGMAMTMDFRGDRLTVSYDAAMRVLSARCG